VKAREKKTWGSKNATKEVYVLLHVYNSILAHSHCRTRANNARREKEGGDYFINTGAILTIPYVLNNPKAVANREIAGISNAVICSTTHCASSIVSE
jgi:hypothetical protein